MRKLIKGWKRLSKGRKIFQIYSLINLIAIFCASKNIGILNEDMGVGMAISYLIYLFSYEVYMVISLGEGDAL